MVLNLQKLVKVEKTVNSGYVAPVKMLIDSMVEQRFRPELLET
jgi:hypothetical protein